MHLSTAPLSLSQLERHLYTATNFLRGKVDPTAYQEYFFGLLFLKRCSDLFEEHQEQLVSACHAEGSKPPETEWVTSTHALYTDTICVPPEARWSYLCSRASVEGNAERLDQALAMLGRENASLQGALSHITFSRDRARLSEQALRDLLRHFSKYRLRDTDLEFPDLLGAAYEYLLADFAGSALKRAGEFYTPRDVLDVMVRMLEPAAGMRVYDPCCGSGGTLILALQYMLDGGGSPRDLCLYGQESNGATWALCKMNALMHGSPWADIRHGDTLAQPQHVADGEFMRFDRIISNPPYSQNYTRADLAYPERFRYGYCPETGKRGDLMFVQHMLAVLAPEGMLATVVPHGVLFRGGAEQAIRAAFVEDDMLEAVIGLPQNLFYGTGIPTCILIMRPPGGKPAERRGRVLFINAEADYVAVRGQNRLSPAHREQIVHTFKEWRELDGYAAVVEREALSENDFNLSIRRYVDNMPPPELHDVRAHLLGGVPKVEADLIPHLAAHGLDVSVFFCTRTPDDGYLDFRSDVTSRGQIKELVAEHAEVRARGAMLVCACWHWWESSGNRLLAGLRAGHMWGMREDLQRSFVLTLSQPGLLDSDDLRGIFATWWEELRYDRKTLAAQGYEGLFASWCASIATGAVQAEGQRTALAEGSNHKLLASLLPDYLEELERESRAIADLEGQLAEMRTWDEEEDEAEPDVPSEEVQTIRKQLASHRRERHTLQAQLSARMEAACAGLDRVTCQQIVLDLLLSDLLAQLEQRIAEQRGRLIAAVEHLWDKYRVSLQEIKAACQASEQRMDAILQALGYYG